MAHFDKPIRYPGIDGVFYRSLSGQEQTELKRLQALEKAQLSAKPSLPPPVVPINLFPARYRLALYCSQNFPHGLFFEGSQQRQELFLLELERDAKSDSRGGGSAGPELKPRLGFGFGL